MIHLIDKSALVAEIEKRKKIVEKRLYINSSYGEEGNAAWERDKALYDAYNSLLSFLDTLEVIDPYAQCIQYASIESGIKAHAEEYSFNIESELFNQLTKEQQVLWRKEIEQACISGGYNGLDLAKDPRYKENLEVKEVDLEKELKKKIGNVGECDRHLAKHFFELGMRFSAIGSDYIEGVRGYYETTTK